MTPFRLTLENTPELRKILEGDSPLTVLTENLQTQFNDRKLRLYAIGYRCDLCDEPITEKRRTKECCEKTWDFCARCIERCKVCGK